MKECSQCKIEKDESEFNKAGEGLRSNCRECQKQYRLDNLEILKEKARIMSRKAYNENPDKFKERQKIFYENNKEYYKDYYAWYNQVYYIENKEKINEINNRYRENNKDSLAAYSRKWQVENPDKVLAISAKRRATKVLVEENYTAENRKATMEIFNYRCFNCGNTEKLCIDHHMPLSLGHPLTMNNAVVLCKSCNCSKGAKLPEHFYKSEKLAELVVILNTQENSYG